MQYTLMNNKIAKLEIYVYKACKSKPFALSISDLSTTMVNCPLDIRKDPRHYLLSGVTLPAQ